MENTYLCITMDAKRILGFLREIMANNNRAWFQEHKAEYEAVRQEFERGVAQAIERISSFDQEIVHLTVKDCTYRFYRDTRFSPDKSPYKTILEPILMRRVRRHCEVDITCIWSQVIVCWLWVTTGCLRIS